MSFEDLESGRWVTPVRFHQQQEDPSRGLAAGIFQISTAVAAFQRLVNTLGTPKDTPHLRHKLHKSRLQIGQLVKETSTKLKQASETDQHAAVSASKKISDAKLAKDFQYVLKEFQKAQRLAVERESAYSLTSQQILPSSNSAIELDTNLLRSKEQMSLLVETRREDVVLVENEIVFNEAIIEEREQGIKDIQQQIGEVNEIFKDLAVLVREQGAMIDYVGTNIENTQAATAQGTSQLTKASKIQRANSSMNCLLLVIFGIILLIVVVVVVA